MKFTLLGSGGSRTIPRPTCQCKICKEARIKGIPYARNGSSLFFHELDLIIDTPKDIINSINRENIKSIKNIIFTHWHPDHTEGMRLVEEITSEWKDCKLKNHGEPIIIIFSEDVKQDMYELKTTFGSLFDFYKHQNYIKEIIVKKSKKIDNYKISFARTCNEKKLHSDAIIIENETKKMVYMPCEVKCGQNNNFLKDTDLLFLNNPWFETKEGVNNIDKNHPLRNELFSIEEIIDLIKKYNIKKTVIVHIEEMWRLSYGDYKKLEEKYKQYNLKFGFDGMKITL